MNFLLRLRPWQLFLLVLIPSLFFFDTLFCRFVRSMGYGIYISWIYAIGIRMYKLMPNPKPNIIYFKICSVIVASSLVLTIVISPFMYDYEIPVIICLMICFIYMMAFSAKMLESMIEGEIVGFSDATKAFFCFWFFPFGLWYVQPAVQRVLDKYN